LLVLLLSFASAARAQAAPGVGERASIDEQQLYDDLIDRTFDEFANRNWLAARTLLLRAHAIHATARTWRGLGITAFNLHDYAQAALAFERALSCRVRPLEGELRGQVVALLAQVNDLVARSEFKLVPPEGRLTSDKAPMRADPSGRVPP
jgi:hypothetical protein